MRSIVTGMALLALGAAVFAQQPAAPAPTTAESFAVPPLVSRPVLSPAGDRYLSRIAVRDENYLMIGSVLTGGPKRIFIPINEQNELQDYFWVNDEWAVIRLATTLKVRGRDFRVRRVFGVSAVDGRLVPLARKRAAQEGGDVLWVARDGTPRILLSLQQSVFTDEPDFFPEVYEVDVSTGEMRSRVRPHPGVLNWYADGKGVVRMGIVFDDLHRSTKLLYRDGAEDAFRTVDKANLQDGERLLVPELFLTDSGKALARSNSDGYDALYELDLADMTFGKRLFGVEGFDIGEVLSDPTGSQLVGVGVTDSYSHISWMDPGMARVQADLDKAVGKDMRASVISRSHDGKKMIVHVGAADTPGQYYFYDRDHAQLSLLAQVNDNLKSARLHPVSTIQYKARDGLQIPAVLTLPRDLPPRNLPLIVMPHGGPAARDEEDWDWWSEYLAQLGYAVIKPNYRGSTGFGAAFYFKGEGEWGLAMQDDLLDVIDHLASQGIADPKRVCIVGASYGGYAALRGAQRDAGRYRCAISYAGVSDISGMMDYDSRFFNEGVLRDYRKRQAPDYNRVSPLNFPQEFSMPVLLMHGTRDLTVPVAQSRSMASRLQQAGKEVKYIEQPLGDHHFSRYEDRLQFLREMADFLQKHNPAH